MHLFLAISFLAIAQKGTIKGLVTDAKTKEPLVGATVMLDGTTTGTVTDFEGKYEISSINPGKYKIRCSFISYETQFIENVTVSAGKTLTFNFKLGASNVEINDVKVVGHASRQSENMTLLDQKNSIVATQAIGAQEISRKGASDAEAAVTKISGISKQEGVKNVIVRGLGDRFNYTSFNGFPLPSEDPEYKNVALDFFDSEMIEAIEVNKVFGAQTPGDVGGAEINITSRQLAKDAEFETGISAGANTKTITKNFLKADGVNAFGYAGSQHGPTDLTKYNFPNSLDPSSQNFQLNRDFSMAGGKKYLAGTNKNPLRFFLLGKYSTDFDAESGKVRKTITDGTITQDQDAKVYTQNTSHIVMGNLDYLFGNNNHITYNGLYLHTNIQYVGDYFGPNTEFTDLDDGTGLIRRQQVNDNTLIVNQILYKKQLKKRLGLDSGISYNHITGNEPDRRLNYLTYLGNDILRPLKGTGVQQRYFSEVKEDDICLKLAFSYKLKENDENKSALNFGYNGRYVSRNFDAVEYDHSMVQQPELNRYTFSLDEVFNQEELDAGDFELDRQDNSYSVDKYINDGYGELIYEFNKKFTAIAGLKGDKVNMNVDYSVNNGGTPGSSKIDKLYILPSLNLKYDLNENNSLRLGLSNTYTLPQDKEISPYRYVYINYKSQGNPDLKPAYNYNVDLKWDNYLSNGELISLSGFFKLVKDPIARIEKASAGGYLTYDNISDKATVAGAEVELRKNLMKRIGRKNAENKISVGMNASYTYTHVKHDNYTFTNKSSKLEGAAPVIINADLAYSYTKNDFSLTNTLVLSYFSDRIYTIGTQDEQDIMEKAVPTLDFVSKSRLSKHWGMGFKVKNLLDPPYRLTREPTGTDAAPVDLENFKKGITVSLGISYNL